MACLSISVICILTIKLNLAWPDDVITGVTDDGRVKPHEIF